MILISYLDKGVLSEDDEAALSRERKLTRLAVRSWRRERTTVQYTQSERTDPEKEGILDGTTTRTVCDGGQIGRCSHVLHVWMCGSH